MAWTSSTLGLKSFIDMKLLIKKKKSKANKSPREGDVAKCQASLLCSWKIRALGALLEPILHRKNKLTTYTLSFPSIM